MRFGIFVQNYKVHLIILLISLLIWVHVKTENIYDEVIPVKVVPTDVNPEYVITNDFRSEVQVQFRGTGKNLIVLNNADIEILADLQQTTQSSFVVQLNLKNIRITPSVVNVQPVKFLSQDTIHFALDALRYKVVPIEHKISIMVDAGYTKVGPIVTIPSEVTVSGPKKLVMNIDSIQTEELQMKKVRANVSGEIKFQNPYPGKLVLSEEQVEYFARIEQLGEKVIDDVKVQVFNPPSDKKVTVIPSTFSIKIIGGVNVISKFDRNDILAYIDYRRYRRGNEDMLPATIQTPENVTFSDVYPQKFRIKVENK